jgi:DNA replication and repair protein RecF
LRVRALTARSFRNLGEASASFAPGVNLIVGGNGEGKTSLLEAISVLANWPFRTARELGSSPRPRWLRTVRRIEGARADRARAGIEPTALRRRLLVNGTPAPSSATCRCALSPA